MVSVLKKVEDIVTPIASVRPVPSTALWILDLGRLEDLRSTLRADNVYSFISIYLHNLSSHMEHIQTALNAGDVKGVAERATMMMHTSENVGAIQNWDLAGKVLEATQIGGTELDEAVEALRYSVEITSDALESWRNTHVSYGRERLSA